MSLMFSGWMLSGEFVFFKATRACEILGMLATMAALVFGVLKMFVMKQNNTLPKVAGGLSIVAGTYLILKSMCTQQKQKCINYYYSLKITCIVFEYRSTDGIWNNRILLMC